MTAPEVRILTVRQPWAWAIVQGGKDVENRTRNIAGAYRGLVAIHAGLRPLPAGDGAWWAAHLAGMQTSIDGDDLHRGHIIGVVELTDVHDDCVDRDIRRLADLHQSDPEAVRALPDDGPGGLIGRARPCSPWSLSDHQHLVLANARPLTAPIPYAGALGLRRLPDDVAAQVLATA